MTVHFFFLNSKISLPERTRLNIFISSIFKKEKTKSESLTYIFCSDEYLLQINKQYLQHNFYTDIITFNLAEPSKPVIGEIYISIDRVKENALKFGVTINEELHRVIFHGALHLCGYKDKSKADKEIMRGAENKYLRLYFKNLSYST